MISEVSWYLGIIQKTTDKHAKRYRDKENVVM